MRGVLGEISVCYTCLLRLGKFCTFSGMVYYTSKKPSSSWNAFIPKNLNTLNATTNSFTLHHSPLNQQFTATHIEYKSQANGSECHVSGSSNPPLTIRSSENCNISATGHLPIPKRRIIRQLSLLSTLRISVTVYIALPLSCPCQYLPY